MNFNVTTRIEYILYFENNIKYQTIVTANGTATMNDAFVGTKRLRIANENSAKENIKNFIEELSKINN